MTTLFYNKERSVKISRNIFRLSGIYGLMILVPQLFREEAFATAGVPLTHPEFFYGFFLISLAFQVLFLIISSDPAKYRFAMLACFIEKGGHFTSCLLLFLNDRLATGMMIASSPDALMLCLFIYSYIIISPGTTQPGSGGKLKHHTINLK